ncbi:hypothetical protein PQX77_020720 [Marasmius sp. AFHP31]|nr:hypothetical protein PQX77_020720 [Marasmius sp. AFHP31]
MRAHYHSKLSGDLSPSDVDGSATPRPASHETLQALKYQLYPKQHSSRSLEEQFGTISKELGFPWVIEPYDILWMFTRGYAYLDIEAADKLYHSSDPSTKENQC